MAKRPNLGGDLPPARLVTLTAAEARKRMEPYIDTPAPCQRTRRPARIARYVRDMKNARWSKCFAPIVFDKNGIVIDGQHRLLAQIQAGITLTWYVVEGANREDIQGIDIGGIRDNNDIQRVLYDRENGKRLAAIANSMAMTIVGDQRLTLTPSEKNYAIAAYEDSILWAANKQRKYTAPVFAAFAMAKPVTDTEKLEAALESLVTGAGLPHGDPILALKTWLDSDAVESSGSTRYEMVNKTLNAIFHKLRGKPLKRIHSSSDVVGWFVDKRKKAGLDKWLAAFNGNGHANGNGNGKPA